VKSKAYCHRISVVFSAMDTFISQQNQGSIQMTLTNDTMSLFPAYFLATDDRRIDCMVDTRVWLIAHYFITVLVDAHCLFICWFLCSSFAMAFLVSPGVRRLTDDVCSIVPWRSHANERGFSYVLFLLLKDMSFVLVYVSGALLCEWLRSGDNGDRIGLMKIRQWTIEATILPGVLLLFVASNLLGCFDLVFDEYQLAHLVLTSAKIPLFFWMRYAEDRFDLYQNRREVYYVIRICDKFVLGRPSR
jgi:hypothetical protein